MLASLLSVLLASAQPAPTEEPVVTDVEVQAEVDVPAEAPAEPAEPETPTATAEAEVEAAPAEPQEEIICRRHLRPAERIGQRHRVVRDCRPASEWARSSRTRRGGD